MTTGPDAAGAIVAGIDGSAEAERALRWAADEAALRGVRLHLVYGFAPLCAYEGAGLPVLHNAFAELEQAGRELLDEAARNVPAGVPVTTGMPADAAVPMLVEFSRWARMIVLGTAAGGGFLGRLTGSTAGAVCAHARCPVVVVRGGSPGGPVVVGVDGSPASEPVIAAAFDEASWRRASLVALHVYPTAEFGGRQHVFDEERAVLAESLAGWPEKYPDVPVERLTMAGRPRQLLLDQSRRAALVVVGSRRRGGFAGLLLGSTSQAMIHHAGCPVMIVPAR